ncbi:MAG: hypothetical protein AAF367_19370 [Pseudomonadota bacterium]
MTNQENVAPEAIDGAKLETGAPPGPVGNDPLTKDPILDQKMGVVGKAIGHGEEKKGNIAAIVIFLFSIILVGVIIAYLYTGNGENKSFLENLITPLFGIFTGAIGYITGRKD